MSWGGATGMDAERAPLGHGWPVGASPHHGAGVEGTPAKQGPDVSAEWFPPFAETKGVDRQGETSISRTANAVGAPRFEAQRQN